MKVVLSRKGMDSASGGIPSPILPNGTLLSLPIPDPKSEVPYGALVYKGHTYQEIIQQICPTFNFQKHCHCHLDPDIYGALKDKPVGWKPAFGQYGIPAKHLDRQGVDVGDVFLFYGMFRQTQKLPDGTLRFVNGAPTQHIIYRYMVVSEILKNQDKIEKLYSWHPHAASTSHPDNRLYLAKDYGVFENCNSLLLSKPNQQNSRRLWSLPTFFAKKGISISWQGGNGPRLVGDHAEMNSSCRGQEFVITANAKIPGLEEQLREWTERLIGHALA